MMMSTVDAGSAAAEVQEDSREVSRWAFYGFANHGWTGAIGTVLIGPWLLALAKHAAGGTKHTLFSIGPLHLAASAFPSFALTVAALLQMPILPALGAAADTLAAKRRILMITCAAGSAVAALLATTAGGAWLLAGALFIIGSLLFGANDVVYNAYLPHLVPRNRRNAVSSRGFAVGYLGSGLLIAVDLAILQLRHAIGISESTAVRICFTSAGLWWAGFGLYAIAGLRERPAVRRATGGRGFGDLRSTLRQLARMPQTRRYLISYLLFSDAISSVIGLASTYVTHELYDDDATRASPFLFALILLIQFIAIGGSLLFARIAGWVGTKRAVLISLVIWCFVVIYAYSALHTKSEAVAMGVVLAVVLGGSQALARSLFSQMVPRGHEAAYFGMYEICDRGTSWIAPLLFTLVVNATGSFRQAILSLIVLFVAGFVLLAATDVDAARTEAAGAT
ncbi:MAG: MFS transporter [Pseudonocardiales bacterium]|nr:MAG: MFS transporter [Pseudonocardiales bacterium]